MDSTTDRKTAAAEVDDKKVFEVTEFGRKRMSRVPKPLRVLAWLIAWPFRFLYQKFRPSSAPGH